MTNSRKELSFSGHTHSGYASSSHTHSQYALTTHTHTGYAATNHTHSQYMTESQVQALIESSSGIQKKTVTFTKDDFTIRTHTGFGLTYHYCECSRNLNTLCEFIPDSATMYMSGFKCRVKTASDTISRLNNKTYTLTFNDTIDRSIPNNTSIYNTLNCMAYVDLNYTNPDKFEYNLWLSAYLSSDRQLLHMDITETHDQEVDDIYHSTYQNNYDVWVSEILDFNCTILFLGPTTA